MRILVTGSSGQIGTNLALRLLREGHEVYGIDWRPNGWTDRIDTILQDLSQSYTTFAGGIGGATYPAGIDVVVHLAAYAKVHELVMRPERAMKNIQMAFNILEYCRHAHLPLIFGSTREVYGDVQREVTEEGQAHFMTAESPYAASKIAGESLVYAYARCYGLPYLVFRFSNVYGRYDNDLNRMERVIPLFIHKVRNQEALTVYGREKVLDFTYIDDCVAGLIAGIEALVRGTVHSHTLNLAYGQGHTLDTLIGYISAAVGLPAQVAYAPTRAGEVTRYVADIARARAILNYRPCVPLEEGIKRAVSWSCDWSHSHPSSG